MLWELAPAVCQSNGVTDNPPEKRAPISETKGSARGTFLVLTSTTNGNAKAAPNRAWTWGWGSDRRHQGVVPQCF